MSSSTSPARPAACTATFTVDEKGVTNMHVRLKQAYELGAAQALSDLGLTKQASVRDALTALLGRARAVVAKPSVASNVGSGLGSVAKGTAEGLGLAAKGTANAGLYVLNPKNMLPLLGAAGGAYAGTHIDPDNALAGGIGGAIAGAGLGHGINGAIKTLLMPVGLGLAGGGVYYASKKMEE